MEVAADRGGSSRSEFVMPTPEERARLSLGISDEAIYKAVSRTIAARMSHGQTLVDVGCGEGFLWQKEELKKIFDRYVGVDAVKYDSFPADAHFFQADLNSGMKEVPSNFGDVVASLETIEHLENPRALMRELVRITKPGGWVIVTTPNQLSFVSILCLVLKHRFEFFQEVHYPAHLTALLEIDLIRIARECGLSEAHVEYTESGRIILTPWHYPAILSRALPRACSDNVLLVGQKPR